MNTTKMSRTHVLIAISGFTFGMSLHILKDGDSSINDLQAAIASASVISTDVLISDPYY